jgi:hypothetical protein
MEEEKIEQKKEEAEVAEELSDIVKIALIDGDATEHIATNMLLFPREAREGHWFEMIYLDSIDKTYVKFEWELIELFTLEELLKDFKYVEYQENQTIVLEDLEFIEQDWGLS